MKKIYLIVCGVLLACTAGHAQGFKFFYPSVRIGMSQSLQSAPYNSVSMRQLYTPDGFKDLYPDITNTGFITDRIFAPDFNAGLLLNFDFPSGVGLVVGGEYAATSLSAKYITGNSEWLKEKNTMMAFSMPAWVKLGRTWYIYLGYQLNYNYKFTQRQKVSFSETGKKRSYKVQGSPSTEVDEFSHLIVGGIHMSRIDIELDYMPDNFLNVNYTDPYGNKPYANHPERILTCRLMFHLAYPRREAPEE